MIRPSQTELEEDLPPASYVHQQASRLAGDMTEPGDHPSMLLDTLAAPFRGVEGAVRSAYNGVDLILADALPDYNGDKRTQFLGTSQTMPGKITENVTEFLTGFIPVVGQVGKVTKAIGLTGKVGAFATNAAAGAITDFVAFEGHEERLSNLIQQHPELSNPITAYLAAGPGDSEAEGRFKNALEGLALGALVEPVSVALKAMSSVRSVRAGKATADAVRPGVDASVESIRGGVKKHVLESAEASFSATLKEKPELEGLSDALAKLSEEDIAGGGLFQDPKKDIGRFLDSPSEVLAVLRSTSRKQMAEEGGAAVEAIATRNAKESKLLSELIDVDPEVAADVALGNSRDLTEATYLMGATRKLMLLQAKRVAHFAGFASKGAVAPGFQSVEQTALEAVRAQQSLSTLVLASRKNGTAVGRALNAIKHTRYAEVESLDLARQAIDQLGGTKFVSAELEKLAMAGAAADPQNAAKGVLDMTRAGLSTGDRLLRAHNEYWINAILSGTKTSFVNTLGNSMTTLWQPLEQAIGGLVQKDTNAVAASLKGYVYLAESFKDSWNFFMRALRENENILLPSSKVNDLSKGPAIDASNLVRGGTASEGLAAEARGLVSGDGNMLSHFVNFVGETTRLPTRFLMASDELFKQINYRSAAKTNLYYRGKGKGLDGAELAAYVSENFNRLVTEGGSRLSEGAVIREGIAKAEAQGLTGKAYSSFLKDYVAQNFDATRSALGENFDITDLAKDVAEEATFTRELGTFGKGVQNFAASHPVTQLLIPFVRTPTNIVKYFGQRGLGALTFMPGIGKLQARNIAELTSTDALVRAKATGRIAAGTSMVAAAGLAALEGKITGRGPRDEHEKRLLMATGWQPYSIVIETAEGPTYVSYQRMDPLASFLGLVADWSEQAKRQDPFQTDALEATLTAVATAVSANVTNKTYLASLAQAIDAINQPERRFSTWARARVGSYVPSLLAQFNSSLDDGQTMKEIRGFFDGAANRIPGAQGLLEPKRNVLGEPVDSVLASTPMSWVNPFVVSHRKGDPVFEELAKLNHGLQPPSPLLHGRVNLLDYKTKEGRTAYDRWLETIGEVEVQGKTLRESLGRLIKQADYQKLLVTAPGDGFDSPRLAAVKRVLNAYRQAALYKVQREIPEVRQAVVQSMDITMAARRGDRAKALSSVQALIQSAQ